MERRGISEFTQSKSLQLPSEMQREKHKIIEAISWREAVGCCVIKGGMRKSNFLEFLQSDSCPELDARKVVIRVRKWRV
jgi:hypothetical protein